MFFLRNVIWTIFLSLKTLSLDFEMSIIFRCLKRASVALLLINLLGWSTPVWWLNFIKLWRYAFEIQFKLNINLFKHYYDRLFILTLSEEWCAPKLCFFMDLFFMVGFQWQSCGIVGQLRVDRNSSKTQGFHSLGILTIGVWSQTLWEAVSNLKYCLYTLNIHVFV